MTVAVFWTAVASLLYTHVGFPALVLVRAALRPRPCREADVTPAVTIVVVARNEAASIGRKLESTAALDYPRDRLEVLVVSDGSHDATAAIAAGHAPLVRVLDLPRVGKHAALAAGAAEATGEVLVFSDANSTFSVGALRALVRPFADPEVGGVAGDQRYTSAPDTNGVAAGERSYWNFDRLLKRAESRAGNVISATGSIYAVRRSLFRPPPSGVTDDFAVSTAVIEQGRRLVFAPDAVAYEPVAGARDREFARKVRIVTRGLRGVGERRALLDPRAYGFYSVQLLSHKLLRRAMAFPLAALATTSLPLSRRGGLYRAATGAQTAFYALAAAGLALDGTRVGTSRPLALPAYACLVNGAAVVAVWNLIRGRRIDVWEPRRGEGDAREAAPVALEPVR